MASDLYIIAAGKGSRMNSAIPKALIPITDEPCLTTTLQQIGHKFQSVFIVANESVDTQWEEYFVHLNIRYPELAKNVVPIYIRSGLGDGHATLTAFHQIYRHKRVQCQDIVVAWGDVFFKHAEIIDELLSQKMFGSGLLPAIMEDDPYVSLSVNADLICSGADFSKYGEKNERGYHDQSVFRFNLTNLKSSLIDLDNALWKKNKYITPGGELSLLYTFHHLHNNGIPAHVYETKYPTLSFNTIEEVFAIQQEIDNKWKIKNRS